MGLWKGRKAHGGDMGVGGGWWNWWENGGVGEIGVVSGDDAVVCSDGGCATCGVSDVLSGACDRHEMGGVLFGEHGHWCLFRRHANRWLWECKQMGAHLRLQYRVDTQVDTLDIFGTSAGTTIYNMHIQRKYLAICIQYYYPIPNENIAAHLIELHKQSPHQATKPPPKPPPQSQ